MNEADQTQTVQIVNEFVTIAYSDYKGPPQSFEIRNCTFIPDRVDIRAYISPFDDGATGYVIKPLDSLLEEDGKDTYYTSNTFSIYSDTLPFNSAGSPICVVNFSNNLDSRVSFMNINRCNFNGRHSIRVSNNSSGEELTTGVVVLQFTFTRFGNRR
jgi:hypothetical protein